MLLIWLGSLTGSDTQAGTSLVVLDPSAEERTLTPIDPATTVLATWGIPGRLITP